MFTLAYLSDSERPFDLEFTIHKRRTEAYALGDGFGHFAISVENLDSEHARFEAASPETRCGGRRYGKS